MTQHIHFAPLESPTHAFRALCGAWREDGRATTARDLVTCPDCTARLAGSRQPEPTTRHDPARDLFFAF